MLFQNFQFLHVHASRGSVMQGWLGGGLCRCETEKWNSLIMQLFTLIPVEWNILILGGIRWWGGGGQKIYCQGGKSWRVGLILPNLYFQLIYSFNVQYTYWCTHGPLMKKYLLTSRIQNKACKVWPGSYYLLCLCTYCTDKSPRILLTTIFIGQPLLLPLLWLAGTSCANVHRPVAVKKLRCSNIQNRLKSSQAPRTSEVMHFLQGWSRECGDWKGKELDRNRAK